MRGFPNLPPNIIIIIIVSFFVFFPRISISADTLTSTQSLSTNQTLVSETQIFELGFFSSSKSQWYLGIWYHNIDDKTIVWVANRDAPLSNPNGILTIGNRGNLVILDQTQNPIWSTNQTTPPSSNSNPLLLHLLDSGNLVLRPVNTDDNPNNYLWQSFDYPTDTLLPGMKLGWDLIAGREKHITSWKSTGDDPTTGDCSFKMDIKGLPEIFLFNKQKPVYRSGPWNGERFSGVPEMQPGTDSIKFSFVADDNEVYYTFSIGTQSLLSRLVVTSNGELQRLTWIESTRVWTKFWYAPKDQCDYYRECGAWGACDANASPVCDCVRGFRPKNVQAWNLRDGSDGCVRKTELECEGDGFWEMKNVKVPETTTVAANRSVGLAECGGWCRRNCTCTAYASIEIENGGSGCVMWSGDLMDIRQYPQGGQSLFVRLAASDVGNDELGSGSGTHKAKVVATIVSITVAAVVILLGLGFFFLYKRKKLQRLPKGKTGYRGTLETSRDLLVTEAAILSNREHSFDRNNMDDLELPLFDFDTITKATSNFSEENKLGQGGFGSVYRGRLVEGQEIAVKRLSETSGQGIEEFKNEVKLIVRLQHRNLVRLLGCCIDMDEKLLVYEYLENRSLDSILFDKAKSSLLDWQRRFNIICGIARGLLYLHQDSRFRIIHRDLKASNILLDREMNPKISDFGMARIFGTDQTEANTLRVVGTYGYMSPEYAMDGLFSVKSDVFSFGVLVLEIISGKKNRGFYYSNNELNLLGHAWMLWKEGKALELIDTSVGDLYVPSEVLRCIQVGLLCVQERAEDRPTMSTVVLMLSSENATIAQPKNPGFCLGRKPTETDSSSSKQEESCTVNQVTVTMLNAR